MNKPLVSVAFVVLILTGCSTKPITVEPNLPSAAEVEGVKTTIKECNGAQIEIIGDDSTVLCRSNDQSSNIVVPKTTFEPSPAEPTTDGATHIVVTPNGESLNLRDRLGNITHTVVVGTKVRSLGNPADNGYLEVKAGDTTGFLYTRYLEEIK